MWTDALRVVKEYLPHKVSGGGGGGTWQPNHKGDLRRLEC